MEFKGRHIMLDLQDCDLPDNSLIRDILLHAVEQSGATVLGVTEHHFTPRGYTCLVLISESHASIHTFPEARACFIDYFTCGNIDPTPFVRHVLRALEPGHIIKKEFIRQGDIFDVATPSQMD